RKIKSIDDMKSAAFDILKLGAKKVVVKGGHLEEERATDILYDGQEFKRLQSRWVETKNTHGTGCTFSSAIAANIALGKNFFEAVTLAKEYITGAIEHALSIGKGHGPTHHFFDLYAKAKLNPNGSFQMATGIG
ncbi:MAG: bifunctional hydroxymethylpyrimidine kinase/phosphomethylpyrimidine kinase, partial [Desulfobacterales bacterium]